MQASITQPKHNDHFDSIPPPNSTPGAT